MSNERAADDCPPEPGPRWPAAEIAAAWRRELPGARTGSIEIITPVWRIAKLLADDRRRTLAALGIDAATLDLLSVIRRSGPPYELTTREITRRTLVTAGAVSQRVARAERAGLVARAPSSRSRRGVAVRLTTAGHALTDATVRELLDHEADLLDVLTARERAGLAGALAKLECALTPPQEASSEGLRLTRPRFGLRGCGPAVESGHIKKSPCLSHAGNGAD